MACWAIWSDRNKLVHGDSISLASIKSNWIRSYLDSFKKANSRRKPNQLAHRLRASDENRPSRWLPPPSDYWKLNVDAACLQSTSLSGLGTVCRKKNGDLMFASSHFVDFWMDPLRAEVRAVWEGLKNALSMGCLRLRVESYSLLAINFINKNSLVWEDMEADVAKVWELIPQFLDINFSFIPRHCNKLADLVAKYARSSRLPQFGWAISQFGYVMKSSWTFCLLPMWRE